LDLANLETIESIGDKIVEHIAIMEIRKTYDVNSSEVIFSFNRKM
tara:strand:+ start:131 stop:265 length:135 start_codon:yes stop_codon:yes gene_type:complete